MTEWIQCRVGERTGDKKERQVEVGQREKGKEETEELIDEFNVKEDFTSNGVVGGPDLSEVYQRVDSSKESSIEPSSSLRYKLRNGILEMLAGFIM